jgi:hypothetical protein
MKRLIVALMVGGALFAVVAFAAASMTLNAGSLSQSGKVDVTDCAGGNWVSLHWNTGGEDPVLVTSVDVNAPATCDGAGATVEMFGNSFHGSGSCTLASGTCNANVPDTDVALVDRARVTLTGP